MEGEKLGRETLPTNTFVKFITLTCCVARQTTRVTSSVLGILIGDELIATSHSVFKIVNDMHPAVMGHTTLSGIREIREICPV